MALLILIALNLKTRETLEIRQSEAISRSQCQDRGWSMVSIALPGSGFSLVIDVDSQAITPDISKQLEFRTSQLVVFNGKSWPSRKVLYRSTVANGPSTVMVLPLDAYGHADALRAVLHERQTYCHLHGYGLFARYVQDFAALGKPAAESLGMAPLRMLRQAMLAFPEAHWFWLLSSDGHIRDLTIPLLAADPEGLRGSLQEDLDTVAVSITHFTQTPDAADIVVTSEPATGVVSARSFAVRRSLASQVFLELTADPLLQNWEPFIQSGDHAGTALTHILRWHPVLLKSVGLLNPRLGGTQKCADTLPEDAICMLSAEESTEAT